MPATNKTKDPIHSMATLKAEKLRLRNEIEQSSDNLGELVTGIPGRILGNTMSMVANAVVQGLQNHWKEREEKKSEEAMNAGKENEPASFGQTLQAVGEETAYFAIARLVEKLVSK
jgi:hypothetical protein